MQHNDFVPGTIFLGAFITLLGTAIALIRGLGLVGILISFGVFLIFLGWFVDGL